MFYTVYVVYTKLKMICSGILLKLYILHLEVRSISFPIHFLAREQIGTFSTMFYCSSESVLSYTSWLIHFLHLWGDRFHLNLPLDEFSRIDVFSKL